MRVLVAGATGAIGRPLIPELVAAGHQVIATTRSPAKLAGLRDAGAEPVVLDGLDALAVGEAVARAEPEVIIHEMTAIPASISMRRFDDSFAPTNALRTRGTDYLLAAAAAAACGGEPGRAGHLQRGRR
jgi:nucleoside-diphosphate-sugar epimerase